MQQSMTDGTDGRAPYRYTDSAAYYASSSLSLSLSLSSNNAHNSTMSIIVHDGSFNKHPM